MRLEVEIERLVLDGLSAAEGRALAGEIERELGRLLGGWGGRGETRYEGGGAAGRFDAADIARRVARHIASAVGASRSTALLPAPAGKGGRHDCRHRQGLIGGQGTDLPSDAPLSGGGERGASA